MFARNGYAICLLATIVFATSAHGQALRYRWASGQKLAYEVEINADLPDKFETLTGAIQYQLKAGGTPAKVTYSGGLTKATTKKPGAAPRSPGFGPFGAGFGPAAGPPGPFERRVNPFKGLERTTNDLVIDGRGSVSAMTGSSQLPYLLGNLSLLIFEPLPEGNEKNWKYDSGVTISEKKENRRNRFDPFGPFGPFGNQSDGPEKTSAATQAVSFALQNESGQLSTYTKTFHLNSPDGETAFKIDGTGKWTFNRQLGASESMDFSQRLTISDGNVSIVVPVRIKYKRLSSQELMDYEKKRLAAAEQSRVAALKSSYQNGGYLPPSNLPITADMKLPPNLLIQWKKDATNYWAGTVVEELSDGSVRAKEVGGRRRVFPFPRGRLQLVPKDIDQPKSISAATLTSLYAQAESAGRVEEARKKEHEKLLQRAKAKPDAAIPSDERQQILAGLRSGDYLEMERALQLVAARTPRKDGELNQAVTKATEHFDGMVQLIAKAALPKVLPGPSPSSPTTASTRRPETLRTWTDKSGKYKIEATYLGIDGDNVVLKRKKDGREVKVPIARLSDADQAAIQALQPENPFDP